jgi:hypothetical protein
MFNFIFDGKLGEMLAPVIPSNQLHLAIQHHKNDQVGQLLMNLSEMELSSLLNSSILIAAKFNNLIAIRLLVDRGILYIYIIL